MGNPIQKIETSHSGCPTVLLKNEIPSNFSTFWSIGNLDILDTNLLGIFCSIRCPGNIILNTYDCMRLLRDAGVAVVSGFHAPIEKDCLDILLKGAQPIVVCPARSIARMRIPSDWKKPIDQGRLLILSPFDEKQKRPTVSTAQQRNHLVAMLGQSFLIPYAEAGSKTEQLGREIIQAGKGVYTFQAEKSRLSQFGVKTIEPTLEGMNDFAESLGREVTIPHIVVGLNVIEGKSMVRAWREYKKITQKEMAAKMEISQAAYSQMEKPDANLRRSTLEKIASALDISLEQLTE